MSHTDFVGVFGEDQSEINSQTLGDYLVCRFKAPQCPNDYKNDKLARKIRGDIIHQTQENGQISLNVNKI